MMILSETNIRETFIVEYSIFLFPYGFFRNSFILNVGDSS